MKRMLFLGLDLMKGFYCSERLKCWSGLSLKLIHPQCKGAEEMLLTEGKMEDRAPEHPTSLSLFLFFSFICFVPDLVRDIDCRHT